MDHHWISCEILADQELQTIKQTQDLYGKGRYGFCDFALDGIDLLLQGIGYLQETKNGLNEKGEYKDFESAIRTIAYYNFYHITLTYRAIYNLVHQGYYTESAILLRSIVENLIRMKYLYKQKDINLVNTAFAGHYGYNGETFKIKNKTMFEDIAPGSYKYYRMLCDMAHGAFSANALKIDMVDHNTKRVFLDTGVLLKVEESTFVVNQFSVFLLAHIKLMMLIYPEMKRKMPKCYADKYHKTLSTLESMMDSFANSDKNKKWYAVMKQLIS